MLRRRIYDTVLERHLKNYRQMAFVSGPRQVGKTTSCRNAGTQYLSWESTEVRRTVLQGTEALARFLGLDVAQAAPPVVVFDELHKFPRWKDTLKGLFDGYADHCKFVVTGSSRLDVYRRGGDSLMGRYFLHRMHPFSVAECADTSLPTKPLRPPKAIDEADWNALWHHGGFPEPFITREESFTRKWASLRLQQLSKEDIREASQVQHLAQLGVLVQVLAERSGRQLVYASLAQEVAVAPITVKGWVQLLESLHFGFTVRPWYQSVANSLRKEPKWFLRDWSGVKDEGQRAETFVACHLLKAVEGWTDMGLGDFALSYVRTKLKKEVDFLLTKGGKPWCLVEVKLSERTLSPALADFQEQLKAPHAVQVVFDLPFVDVDCFTYNRPMVVPAMTFLSQLL
jgi:hypothetical protein